MAEKKDEPILGFFTDSAITSEESRGKENSRRKILPPTRPTSFGGRTFDALRNLTNGAAAGIQAAQTGISLGDPVVAAIQGASGGLNAPSAQAIRERQFMEQIDSVIIDDLSPELVARYPEVSGMPLGVVQKMLPVFERNERNEALMSRFLAGQEAQESQFNRRMEQRDREFASKTEAQESQFERTLAMRESEIEKRLAESDKKLQAAMEKEGRKFEAKDESLASTMALYETARDGLVSALEGTETGPVVGRFPAFTSSQQEAVGAVAAMAPVLKQLFRAAGEGVFTDRDQALLLDMIPKRTERPEARASMMRNIDAIVKAKLMRSGKSPGKVKVRTRDGKIWEIPEANVEEAIKRGAVRL